MKHAAEALDAIGLRTDRVVGERSLDVEAEWRLKVEPREVRMQT
jgi:hypothetical protein